MMENAVLTSKSSSSSEGAINHIESLFIKWLTFIVLFQAHSQKKLQKGTIDSSRLQGRMEQRVSTRRISVKFCIWNFY